jgi:hypothetical protein
MVDNDDSKKVITCGSNRINCKLCNERSSGCTAIPVSPNIVSGRVVATTIFSSTPDSSNQECIQSKNTRRHTRPLDKIRKTRENAELKFLLRIIPRHIQ